ncbi:PA2GE phospholipase, partial [Nyctibius bracteatus]|nr:PA2GE phospholipase [Nyctibius bracteatus]
AGLASCSVTQFGSMIKHKTGKSPLSYNRYGCHCGSEGSAWPLDATDWCCHAHNCCYKKLTSYGCRPKLVTYKHTTLGNQILCGAGTWCERQSCECDKRAAECFQRTARTYHKSYKKYKKSRCKGPAPSC